MSSRISGASEMVRYLRSAHRAVLIVLAMLVTSIAATPTPVPTGPPSGDRDALVALYNATDGPNWSKSLNWLTDMPLDTWYGVTTDEGGRVTELSLQDNRLGGQLTAELINLSNLTALRLVGNELGGEIPPEIGRLTTLSVLDLGWNHFTGQIPPELGSLSNLTRLDLAHNQLSGPIPPEIGNLSNLTELFLDGNQLSGQIPAELGRLFKLIRLYLSGNQLSGETPAELGRLSNLQRLLVYGNRLSGTLPPGLAKLSAMEHLHFRDNAGLCAPADDAFQEWLMDRSTSSGDVCPPGSRYADREALVALYYATNGGRWYEKAKANWLSHMPLNTWHGVTTDASGRVIEVDLRDLRPGGQIPVELGNLFELRVLKLGITFSIELSQMLRSPAVGGQIPPELGKLSKLEVLDLFMLLDGQIPPELGKLSKLEVLDLSANRLSGQIPPELGSLTDLTTLYLHTNQLSGPIPPELGRLANLTTLYISQNQLSGALPMTLVGLRAIMYFGFEDNAGLCAPADDSFQDWLRGIMSTSGPNCPESSTSG